MIQLVLPSPPSSNRWWRNVNGRMVLSRAARQYKQNIPLLAGKQAMIRAPHPVRVRVNWFRERKSGDLDKRLGIVLDSLQGVCFENDSQIVELHAFREDDPKWPRVVITVEEVA